MLSNEIDRINSGGLLQRIRDRRRPVPEPEPEMSILPYYGDETKLSKPLRPHEEHKIVKHLKEIGGFKTAKMIAHRRMHGAGFMDFVKDIASSTAGKFIKVALSTIITLFTGIPAETIIETLSPFIESLGTDILGFVVRNADKGFQWIVDKLQEKKDIKDGKKKKKKKTKKTKKNKKGGLKLLTPDHPLYHRLMNEHIPLDEVIHRNKKKFGGKSFNDKFMDGLLWFTHDLVKPIVSHIPIIGTAVGAAIGDVPKYFAERLPGTYEYHNPFESHPEAEQPYIRPPDIRREGIEKGITQSQVMKGRGRKRRGGKIFDPKKGFWANHLAPLATIAKDIALDYAGQEFAAAWKGEKPVYQQLRDQYNHRTLPQRQQGGPRPPGPPGAAIEMETLRPVAAAADAARAVRASAVQDEFKQVQDARAELRNLGREMTSMNPFLPKLGAARHEPALLSHGEEMKVSRSSSTPQEYKGPSHELGLPPKRQSLSKVLSTLENLPPPKLPLQPHPKFTHKLGIFNPREADRPITSQTFEPDVPHISQSNLFQQPTIRPVYEPVEKKQTYKSPTEQPLVRARALSREDPTPPKLTKSSSSSSSSEQYTPFQTPKISSLVGTPKSSSEYTPFQSPKGPPRSRLRDIEYNLNLPSGEIKAIQEADRRGISRPRTPEPPSSRGRVDPTLLLSKPSSTTAKIASHDMPAFRRATEQSQGPTFMQRLAQGPIGQAASAVAAPFISPMITSSLDKAIAESKKASSDARMAQFDKEFNARVAQRKAEKAKAPSKAAQSLAKAHAEMDRIFKAGGKHKKNMKRKTGKGKKSIKRKIGKGKKSIKRKTGKGKKRIYK